MSPSRSMLDVSAECCINSSGVRRDATSEALVSPRNANVRTDLALAQPTSVFNVARRTDKKAL
eukprot:CAMPEP_0177707210 /NCGR_PEP_ID=MMETSP0484_2-20121128/9630_1 /TAXON_ID=354590 /ORGANISM="Rhodomonas lens, Strain RHODO" /LENGTH=62 /DNA_ID=CAMNT_0019218709 /DNA_START=186 /DNA_END=374 /DNA_ORIENTATION=+